MFSLFLETNKFVQNLLFSISGGDSTQGLKYTKHVPYT